MLLPDTRFAIKNSAKNALNSFKYATTDIYHRVQQKLGRRDDGSLPVLSMNPKFRPYYSIWEMCNDVDNYASGSGEGMLRLFGSQPWMRANIIHFFIDIINDRGYSGEAWAMALQILDRFLSVTTICGVEEHIYHYAFVSLMLAVEVIHAHTMSTKLFKRYVDNRCSSKTIKRFKKAVLKTLEGVVSVPNVTEMLVTVLQIAAIECPSVFAAKDKLEQIEKLEYKLLTLHKAPFVFDRSLAMPACQLGEAAIRDQPLQRFSSSELAAACFYILAECMPNVDMSKADNFARHPYKDVEPIVNYLKTIV
ncbi:hypothetical protein LPJ53_000773 [Coemansia erecta]|uniref:Cyclin N-terminal domain-containing protein n=1 Tax=Coemansia erecta TaxID=147472 RepID=A0A9W7Y6S7_9FUNG|nr:hypothetical protein LPJ53_000773 [Coemansia erecta]